MEPFHDADPQQNGFHDDVGAEPLSSKEETTIAPLEMESSENLNPEPKQYLGMLPLAMIVFYNVSGGPFGVEESVRSAGFLFSLLGFLLMPLVWSIPESLITAELGSAYPEASGGVAWVEEAFGSGAGWMAGYLGWVAGATDNAIYPVLFLDYVSQVWSAGEGDLHPILRFVLLSSTTIILGFLNWLGLEVVGKMSIIIGILSLSPFIIMVIIGVFKMDPSRLLELPSTGDPATEPKGMWDAMVSGAILWRPFLNNLFWNLNSYDSTASFAAEVENPGYVLPRSMFLATLIIVSAYFFPLMIAIGATSSTQEDWVDGYLADAAEEIGGEWLGAWVIFAAGVSNIALFQAELSADAFQLMGMADRGFLPKIFARRSRHGTPTYGILLGVGVIVAMGTFNLDKLIEMLNFNYAIALLMEYAAFIKLRISKPDVPRPYKIGLGTKGCILFLTPPMVGILIVMGLASYATFIFSIGVNLVGALLYYSYRGSLGDLCCRYSRLETSSVLAEAETLNATDVKEESACLT